MHAISFVAFCTQEAGVGSADDVSVEIVDLKEDGGGPLAVSWASDVEISTVVVKYGGKGGGSLVAYEGGTNGTSAPDEGTEIDTSENVPCPDGETLLVKFEGNDLQTVESCDGSEESDDSEKSGAESDDEEGEDDAEEDSSEAEDDSNEARDNGRNKAASLGLFTALLASGLVAGRRTVR